METGFCYKKEYGRVIVSIQNAQSLYRKKRRAEVTVFTCVLAKLQIPDKGEPSFFA